MPRRRAEPRAAAIVFALLVLATLAAFAYAQRVKRDPLVLDRVTFVAVPKQAAAKPGVFTPNGDCRSDRLRIRFRTTVSDRGTVQIVKPGAGFVHTLARGEFLKRYTYHTYFWDGGQPSGGTAPPGRYKLRVKLLGKGITLVPPGTIHIHRGSGGGGSACTTRAKAGGVPAGATKGQKP